MPLTIGDVIDALARAEPDAEVYFDFCRCVPTTVDSWRGSYCDAALGWLDIGRLGGDIPTAAILLAELRAATTDKVFLGWKGGEYRFTLSTALHVDNHGCYTCTELTCVEVREGRVVLRTETD